MIRTIISLDDEDKAWLDRLAVERRTTMTQLVRLAIRRYRQDVDAGEPSLERQLGETAGLWPGEDGLEYQRRVRAEWEERGE
ncbi:MAG: CopG family transcriptional regulator [Thermoanaerobaculia bacterium]